MFTSALLRVARVTAIAAVMVAAAGPPMSAAAGKVTLHLASVRCEKEKLRRKLTEGLQCGRMDKATRLWIPDREICATRAGPEPPADRRAPGGACGSESV